MEERWIEQLRRRFADRQADAPEGLWEGIQAGMERGGARRGMAGHAGGRGALTVAWRRAVAAAACIAVLGGAGWLFYGPRTADADMPADARSGQAEAFRGAADGSGAAAGGADEGTYSVLNRAARTLAAAATMAERRMAEVRAVADSIKPAAVNDDGGLAEATAEARPSGDASRGAESVVVRRRPLQPERGVADMAGGDVYGAYGHGRHNGGHVALSVYGGGMTPFGTSGGGLSTSLVPYAVQQGPIYGKDVMLLSSSADAQYGPSAEGNEVRVKHRQPVKVGMSARFRVARRVSLEAGLNYSYHSSDIASGDDNGGYKAVQKLHFVGVPVSVSYDIWHTDYLEVYASAGGAAEFCVSGRSHTDYISGSEVVRTSSADVRDSRPQWSVGASAGVQYNLGSLVGIYAEPGVSYYFDNGSGVSTIYKDKPLNFNLSVGLRFTIR